MKKRLLLFLAVSTIINSAEKNDNVTTRQERKAQSPLVPLKNFYQKAKNCNQEDCKNCCLRFGHLSASFLKRCGRSCGAGIKAFFEEFFAKNELINKSNKSE